MSAVVLLYAGRVYRNGPSRKAADLSFLLIWYWINKGITPARFPQGRLERRRRLALGPAVPLDMDEHVQCPR